MVGYYIGEDVLDLFFTPVLISWEMDIGRFLDLYAIELLSFISVNLLVTFFLIRSFKAPILRHSYTATSMDTSVSKPSELPVLSGIWLLTGKNEGDSNLNLSLAVSSTGSELSDNDLGRLSITPILKHPPVATLMDTPDSKPNDSNLNLSLTVSSTGSTISESSLNGGSITPDLSSSGSTDGSTPSPSPVSERIPQHIRASVAQRLLSLVDSDGRPTRLVKRSALKDITNIARTRPSVPGDDECVDDAQCLVYRSAEEFLPTLVSTPPTCNAPYADSAFFGSSGSRFGDMFSDNAPPSTRPTFALPESFKLSNFAGSITRISGDIVTSLAARYHNDDYEDDGVAMDEQFEWEDEMRSLELRLGFYDQKT